MALRPPARPLPGAADRALADLALDIAHNAASSTRPGVLPDSLDVSAVAAARAGERETLDRITLVREIRAAAAVVLCEVTTSQVTKIIGALQAKHRETVTELSERARRLPPGTDDEAALEAGGQVREDYLGSRDLAELAGRLRETLATVENVPASAVPDAIEFCALYERTGGLYREHWLARPATTRFGHPGTLEFWLAACREDGLEWWLPAAAEARQRAAEVHDALQRERAARQASAFVS